MSEHGEEREFVFKLNTTLVGKAQRYVAGDRWL